MKVHAEARRPGRHEQRTAPRNEDAYRADAKPPTCACPRCGASFLAGRWSWRAPAPGTPSETCPACLRIEANDPAGSVSLAGPFFTAHREEVMARVTALAAAVRNEHPMQRIVAAMEISGGGVLVTTTDSRLARSIAVALLETFKGELDLYFGHAAELTRASWRR